MNYSEDELKVKRNNRWYVIHTHLRQEDRAASNLRAWNVETFVPKLNERQYNRYTGIPSYVSKPLFPRYIFARFDAGAMLHKICYTRGIHSVVSFGDDPTPVEDEIIAVIQSQVGQDGFIKVGEELKSGDKVIVKNGPLKSLVGIFEQKVKASDRVSILLTTINYQGHLVIDRELVKKWSGESQAMAIVDY